MIDTHFIGLPGARQLRLLQTGDAELPPLLCLHGFTGRADAFSAFMQELATERHCLAPDLRGHGFSSLAHDYTVRSYAADLLDLLDFLQLPQVVLYGHSLGGLIALALAGWHPERVAGLICEDPPLLHHQRSIHDFPYGARFVLEQRICAAGPAPRAMLDRARELLPDLPLGRLVDLVGRLSTCDPEIFTPLLLDQLFAGEEVENFFRGVRQPLLLLRGDPEKGSMLLASDLQRVQGQLAGPWHVSVISEAGHQLRLSALPTVLTALRRFLDDYRL